MENARTLSLLIVFFAACAASPPAEPPPWRIEMTSSGGIAGKGAGSMDVDSTGTLSVTTTTGRSCPGRLSSDDARRLAEAVANAKPDGWTPQEPVCCDRIEWSLALTIGGQTHTVTWIDDPKIALPDDLRVLTRLLGEIREKHTVSCRP